MQYCIFCTFNLYTCDNLFIKIKGISKGDLYGQVPKEDD